MSQQEHRGQSANVREWQDNADNDWTSVSPRSSEQSEQRKSDPQVETTKKSRTKRKLPGLVSYNEDDEDDEGSEEEEEEEEEITDRDSENEKDRRSQQSGTEAEEKSTPPAKQARIDSPSTGQPEVTTSRQRYQSTSQDLSESLSKQLESIDESSAVSFEVEGECDPDVQRRVSEAYTKLLAERRAGNSRSFWNDAIQSLKEFRNPSIYEKLIEFIGIDEKSSNFDPLCAVYNMSVFGRESYYDELAKTQHDEMERVAAQQKAAQRAKVEYVSKRPSAHPASASGSSSQTTKNPAANASSTEPQPKRQSKWDAPAAASASKP